MPLWGLAAFGLARQAGLRWARLPLVWWAFLGYTVALVVVGLYQEALLFEPIAVAKDGVLSYQNGSRVTPPLAGAFTTVLLLLVCIPIGLKLTSFWLPAAMLFTLLAAGGLTRLLGSAAINLAEVVLALALLVTALRARGSMFAPALLPLRDQELRVENEELRS
ncbi:MAG: hypothetical protein MUD01_24930 [Chloroflexaceae bacterium]|nr:hypothetical protein [Chloroflexaceae bacterium]